jgi:ABC-2 type transport system ATP-binding protein
MSEMALTAEQLIIIGRGKLIADVSVADFIRDSSRQTTRVRSPQAAQLRDLLVGPDVTVTSAEAGVLEVHGLDSEAIGEIAAGNAMVLHELTPVRASLEEAFMDLTRDSVEYHGLTGTELASAGRGTA